MEPLSLSQIANFAGAELVRGPADKVVRRVSTDSRSIAAGELFVALRGEHFDGHSFLEQVAKAGAAGAIVAQVGAADLPQDFALLRVDDPLVAYQNLAANYRKTLQLRVLGITGSNGKTSTKDFAAAILARVFSVIKTEGNFNNHIGVPRTILEANAAHDLAVCEIGMNHAGEIEALTKIASPDAAIITNVGVAHIEFLGSREAIAHEKGMLAEAIASEGFVVLNADDDFAQSIARRTRARVIFAGIDGGEIRASEVEQTASGSEFTVTEGAHRCRAQLPVPGLHMVRNALLAIAAGRAFGVLLEDCAAGLASTPLAKARLQVREVRGVQFLDDSYNANPDSVKAALRTLAELDTEGQRVAVLGEMAELGAEEESGHREVGEAAATLGVDHLIAVGKNADVMAQSAHRAGLTRATVARDAREAAEILGETVSCGDLVLVKGSRLARMELVLEEFARLETAGGNAR